MSKMEIDGNNKIGNYDWIIDSVELLRFMMSNPTLNPFAQFKRICVLGCGTSTLSVDLLHAGDPKSPAEVVSLDNDTGCLRHMADGHRNEPRLKWEYCDLTQLDGHVNDLAINPFDLVVDKGTFDAILVGGTSWEFLANVHRLLAPRGVFVLCSLHTEDLLQPLLSISALEMDVTLHTVGTERLKGTVALVKKKNLHSTLHSHSFTLSYDDLRLQEKQIMDCYYQQQNPLISSEQEQNIRLLFTQSGQEYLDYKHLHTFLFGEIQDTYTFALFEEDLCSLSFPLTLHGHLNVDEVLGFLHEKQ
jgi:SAM-dependent methyltransferase